MTRRPSAGSGALEDPAGDQLRQPVREDVAGDPKARLELLEMLEAVEGAAKDQERPFLADQLDRGGIGQIKRRLLERSMADVSFWAGMRALLSPNKTIKAHKVPKNSCELKLIHY